MRKPVTLLVGLSLALGLTACTPDALSPFPADADQGTGADQGMTVDMSATGDLGGDMGGQGQENPFKGDAQAAAEGATLYNDNGCVTCHGTDGKSTSFKDLSTLDATPDATLFTSIDAGIAGTAMSAYGETLTDDEIWKIITWIRTID